MALNITGIANSALIKLGQSPITSIDDGTPNANIIKARIDFVRQFVLRLHPWNCAIDGVQSAPSSSSPTFGYVYKHQLPANCLRVLKVDPEEVEYRIQGRSIHCDSNAISITFIKDAPVSDLDVALGEAISLYLAWDTCEKITGSTEQRDRLNVDFRKCLGLAKSIDAQEERDYELDANLFIDSRVGGFRQNRANR